jgi:hypothetical protein
LSLLFRSAFKDATRCVVAGVSFQDRSSDVCDLRLAPLPAVGSSSVAALRLLLLISVVTAFDNLLYA